MSETDELRQQPQGETEDGATGTPVDGDDSKARAAKSRGDDKTPQDDVFDYVIPPDKSKKKKHRHHHHQHDESAQAFEINVEYTDDYDEDDNDYIYVTPVVRNKRGKRVKKRKHTGFKGLSTGKRVAIIIVSIVLVLAIAFGGTFFILREIGRNRLRAGDDFSISIPTGDGSVVLVDKTGRVITYDGVSYELNEDLISVTFIGIDEGSEAQTNTPLQMADAIYIFTFDPKTGKAKILSVSRDTMTDVDVYSKDGVFIDTRHTQISFSYAYGSEKVTGGKNTNTSLMRLFYGLPFNDYFALDMDALMTLNDVIGGVTLTSSMTFTSPENGRTIKEGELVTLHGKEAEYYVRSRNTEKLDSNNARMQRQQAYIQAFMQAAVPAVKKDISVVSKLYNTISSHSDTTLDLPKMTYIASTAASKLRGASEIEYVSLKGTFTEGEFAELNVKDEDAIRTMLDVFYTPLAKIPDGLMNDETTPPTEGAGNQ